MVMVVGDDDDDDDGNDDDDDDDWQPKFRWEAALPHLLKKFFEQVRIFKKSKIGEIQPKYCHAYVSIFEKSQIGQIQP